MSGSTACWSSSATRTCVKASINPTALILVAACSMVDSDHMLSAATINRFQ